MMNRVHSAWTRFVNWNRKRLVWAILTGSVEDHQEISRQIFERAKKLSDFVGMIVRVSFLVLATTFLWKKSQSTEGILGWVFGYSALITFAIAIRLSSYIFIIILVRESKDLAFHGNLIMRIILFAIALSFTAVIWYGAYKFILELAVSSSLL